MASLHPSRCLSHQRASQSRSTARKAVSVRASSMSGAASVARKLLSPQELCTRAQDFVTTGSGYFTPARPELFSEEFIFRGPIVGPLNKKDFLKTLGGFQMYETFPDLASNSYGFCVDPHEPMRVRYFTRQTGTCTGPIRVLAPLEIPATNKKAVVATEACSLLFDDQGKVKLWNVGYCVDYDAPGTNSGKLAAAFGLLAGAGIELPLGKVYSTAQWLLTLAFDAGLVTSPPRPSSKWEELPQWYKDYVPRRAGAQGVPGF